MRAKVLTGRSKGYGKKRRAPCLVCKRKTIQTIIGNRLSCDNCLFDSVIEGEGRGSKRQVSRRFKVCPRPAGDPA